MIGANCWRFLTALAGVLLAGSPSPARAQDLFVGCGQTKLGGGYVRAYDTTTGADMGIFFEDPVLRTPNALALSPNGVLYGLSVRGGDKMNPPEARFVRFDGPGVATELRNDLDFGSGPTPTLAIDSAGRLYVGHNDGWVYRFTANAEPLGPFVQVNGGVPTALTFDRKGNLFTTSSEGWIQKFSPLGVEFVRTYVGEIYMPGLAIDPAGTLFVTRNHRYTNIEMYSPDLVDLGEYAEFYVLPKQGAGLANLGFDRSGNLYVVHTGGLYLYGGHIIKFNTTGNKTTFAQDLVAPFAMAVQRPLTPDEQIGSVAATIEALVVEGAVLPGDGNSLVTKLEGALASLEEGRVSVAVNRLGAFVNQTRALMNSGRLSASQGEALIDQINLVIEQLEG